MLIKKFETSLKNGYIYRLIHDRSKSFVPSSSWLKFEEMYSFMKNATHQIKECKPNISNGVSSPSKKTTY